jgi:hypothetical protein
MEQGPMTNLLKRLDEAANNWHKTKDPRYKDQWYKLIKEFANGTNNLERRTVSTDSSHKTDDGWNSVDKQRRLF